MVLALVWPNFPPNTIHLFFGFLSSSWSDGGVGISLA